MISSIASLLQIPVQTPVGVMPLNDWRHVALSYLQQDPELSASFRRMSLVGSRVLSCCYPGVFCNDTNIDLVFLSSQERLFAVQGKVYQVMQQMVEGKKRELALAADHTIVEVVQPNFPSAALHFVAHILSLDSLWRLYVTISDSRRIPLLTVEEETIIAPPQFQIWSMKNSHPEEITSALRGNIHFGGWFIYLKLAMMGLVEKEDLLHRELYRQDRDLKKGDLDKALWDHMQEHCLSPHRVFLAITAFFHALENKEQFLEVLKKVLVSEDVEETCSLITFLCENRKNLSLSFLQQHLLLFAEEKKWTQHKKEKGVLALFSVPPHRFFLFIPIQDLCVFCMEGVDPSFIQQVLAEEEVTESFVEAFSSILSPPFEKYLPLLEQLLHLSSPSQSVKRLLHILGQNVPLGQMSTPKIQALRAHILQESLDDLSQGERIALYEEYIRIAPLTAEKTRYLYPFMREITPYAMTLESLFPAVCRPSPDILLQRIQKHIQEGREGVALALYAYHPAPSIKWIYKLYHNSSDAEVLLEVLCLYFPSLLSEVFARCSSEEKHWMTQQILQDQRETSFSLKKAMLPYASIALCQDSNLFAWYIHPLSLQEQFALSVCCQNPILSHRFIESLSALPPCIQEYPWTQAEKRYYLNLLLEYFPQDQESLLALWMTKVDCVLPAMFRDKKIFSHEIMAKIAQKTKKTSADLHLLLQDPLYASHRSLQKAFLPVLQKAAHRNVSLEEKEDIGKTVDRVVELAHLVDRTWLEPLLAGEIALQNWVLLLHKTRYEAPGQENTLFSSLLHAHLSEAIEWLVSLEHPTAYAFLATIQAIQSTQKKIPPLWIQRLSHCICNTYDGKTCPPDLYKACRKYILHAWEDEDTHVAALELSHHIYVPHFVQATFLSKESFFEDVWIFLFYLEKHLVFGGQIPCFFGDTFLDFIMLLLKEHPATDDLSWKKGLETLIHGVFALAEHPDLQTNTTYLSFLSYVLSLSLYKNFSQASAIYPMIVYVDRFDLCSKEITNYGVHNWHRFLFTVKKMLECSCLFWKDTEIEECLPRLKEIEWRVARKIMDTLNPEEIRVDEMIGWIEWFYQRKDHNLFLSVHEEAILSFASTLLMQRYEEVCPYLVSYRMLLVNASTVDLTERFCMQTLSHQAMQRGDGAMIGLICQYVLYGYKERPALFWETKPAKMLALLSSLDPLAYAKIQEGCKAQLPPKVYDALLVKISSQQSLSL